jgi:hypothetical protein
MQETAEGIMKQTMKRTMDGNGGDNEEHDGADDGGMRVGGDGQKRKGTGTVQLSETSEDRTRRSTVLWDTRIPGLYKKYRSGKIPTELLKGKEYKIFPRQVMGASRSGYAR